MPLKKLKLKKKPIVGLMMNDTERFAPRQSIRNANYGDIPLVEWAAFDEELMEFLENGEEDE